MKWNYKILEEPSKYRKEWVSSLKKSKWLRDMWKQHLEDHDNYQREVELPQLINKIKEREQKLTEIDNKIKKLKHKLHGGSLGRKKAEHPKVQAIIKKVVNLKSYKFKLECGLRRLKEKELMIRRYDPDKVISNYMDLSLK